MTLFEVMEAYSYYGTIHVATEYGKWWIYSGYNADFPKKFYYMGLRKVTRIYLHDGREESETCKKMNQGLAIIIEGTENGTV